MTSLAAKARRLVGLFLLGAVLFNYPVLSLFNRQTSLFGIPVLFLYLFGVWAVLIFFTALVTGRTASGSWRKEVQEEREDGAP